jgi:hypothetical protein
MQLIFALEFFLIIAFWLYTYALEFCILNVLIIYFWLYTYSQEKKGYRLAGRSRCGVAQLQ